MNYEGKMYRPWIEADSLLIQTTIGCTHNKCTFCNMFREKCFRIKDIEEIFAYIEEVKQYAPHIHSIFLTDGNVLALKTDFLLKILEKIKNTLPHCRKISAYAGLNDLRRKTVEELKNLRKAGLTKVYSGLESGDEEILLNIKKALHPDQAKKGIQHAKDSGIEVLLSIIFGIGGTALSVRHIQKTTDLLNKLQPEELAPMALTIQPGTVLQQQVNSGDFIQATPLQILEEEKYLLENLINFPMMYWGDHGNNIETLRGMLPANRKRFLELIDYAITSHPVIQQDILRTSPW